ncbi:MAG: type IX secretion system membrane protein PorP/SprF [Flavobacteriales bacterium]|jgi:type IX secretion system PorP/SprF family membrane protein|nr:type IX secretion system membrane protein PorP/SprF [Flavobacteriales bacterium]
MKKTIFSILLSFAFLQMLAQQDALYSQYMFNQFTINPAYAGTRNSFSSVLLFRNQWSGLSGAPNTLNFSLHTPFSGKKMALGLNFIADEIGPSKNSSIMGTYAYHLQTSKGKLSFGLRGGFYSSSLNTSQLNFFNSSDVHNTGAVYQSITPNFDFGVYYYAPKFYSGLSVNHMFDNNAENTSQTHLNLNRHFFFNTGAVFVKNENLVFKPSFMVRYNAGSPISFDLNTSVLFKKTIWVGLTYRSSKSIIFISEYNISDFLRIGYSYDFDLSKLRKFHSGSHEVFIGCDLNFNSKASKSPRYI